MAKRWVMTPARKRYYESKRKMKRKDYVALSIRTPLMTPKQRASTKKRITRSANKRIGEYGKAFKRELKYTKKTLSAFKGYKGMQRMFTMEAHRGAGNVVKTPEGIAKFQKVRKLMNMAYRKHGVTKPGSWGRRYEKI
jgi:hypothetical protein